MLENWTNILLFLPGILFVGFLAKEVVNFRLINRQYGHIKGYGQVMGFFGALNLVHLVCVKLFGLKFAEKYIGVSENKHMSVLFRDMYFKEFSDIGFMKTTRSDIGSVLVGDANVVKEIFTTHKEKIIKPVQQYAILGFYGHNILISEGAEWKKHRRIADPAFSDNNMKLVASSTSELTNQLIRSWSSKIGTKDSLVIEPAQYIKDVAMGVISEAGFGVKLAGVFEYKDESDKNMTFKDALTIVSNTIILKLLVPNFALQLPIFGLDKVGKAWKQFEEQIYKEISSAKERNERGEVKSDILSLLVAAADKGVALTPLEILSDTFIFYFAGHETTAFTVIFALRLLAQHPEVQQKIFEEVNSVVGSEEEITYAQFSKLTYTKAVFKETLRVFPPVVLVPKQLTEDIEINGTKLYKGYNINIGIYLLHYNDKYWNEPEKFRPERFINNSESINPYAYAPFSLGSRSCIGMKFALIEGPILLAGLVRAFQFDLAPDDDGKKKLDIVSDITLRPVKPIRITIKKRKDSPIPV